MATPHKWGFSPQTEVKPHEWAQFGSTVAFSPCERMEPITVLIF